MRQKSRLFTFCFVLVCFLFSPAVLLASEVALVVSDNSSLYEKRFIDGARQASIDLRIDFRLYRYQLSTGDSGFVALIRDIAKTNPIGIVVEAQPISDIDALIHQAGPHINVVLANFQPQPETKTPFVTWDETHTGAVAADSIASSIKTSQGKIGGEILLLKPEHSDSIVNDRIEGFRNQLAVRYPGITLVTSEVPPNNEDKAIADVFSANHNLVGVFTPDFALSAGAARLM
jgi:ribose transport system substrate-binding protein